MKIAKINSFFWPVKGGVEHYLHKEGMEFINLGHEVTIITSNSDRIGKISKKSDVVDGIKIKRLPTLFRASYFTPIFPKVLLAAMTENYDILHVHSYRQFHNLCVLIAKLRGKAAVITPHWPEYPEHLRTGFLNAAIKVFDKTIGPAIFRFADAVIALTESEKIWLIKKFRVPEKKIFIIGHGVDESYFEKHSALAFRKKNNISRKEKIVLSIGRLHKSKGFHRTIGIAKHFDDVVFVFVGPDGGNRKNLELLARELGVESKIIFTGEVSEKEKIEALAACDVLSMPSDYEAFGIALIEGIALGKPVIASNAGGMPSVVGDCGLVFDAENLADYEEKLRKLLYDSALRKKLASNAKAGAKQHTWAAQTKKLEEIYKTLLAKTKTN